MNVNRRTIVSANLYRLIKATTYKWVADNFGQSEADDPSWNIEELSVAITRAIIDKVEKKGDEQ